MEKVGLDQLLNEKELSKALGISRVTLYGYRKKGCPWLSIGGKAYYFEPDFTAWILKNCRRVADIEQGDTPE